jgi:hypothetical protein
VNNPHQWEADSLRARLEHTTDRRAEKRIREQLQSAERQAKLYEQQQQRKKRNEEKPS